jgi:hypothetical protein
LAARRNFFNFGFVCYRRHVTSCNKQVIRVVKIALYGSL